MSELKKTPWLYLAIGLGWMGNVLFTILAVISFLDNPVIGLFLFGYTAFAVWMMMAIWELNDLARIIYVSLSAVIFLSSIWIFNPIGLVVSGLVVYSLGYHKKTVELFRIKKRHEHYDKRF
ncbi:MAG: hypothetical protein ACXAB7_17205 [Candidatus Kariarchaeaceae archaeon]